MLVFWRERLVLFAVPKTGTTALEGALAPRAAPVLRDPPELKHAPMYRYHRFVRPMLEAAGGSAFETIAVVREPVDWLRSWYRYRARADLAQHPNSTRGLSFDEFVTGYLKGKPPACSNVGSQARFVAPPPGAEGITHLFRYEAQERLLAFLGERLGEPIALRRLNASPQVPAPPRCPVSRPGCAGKRRGGASPSGALRRG